MCIKPGLKDPRQPPLTSTRDLFERKQGVRRAEKPVAVCEAALLLGENEVGGYCGPRLPSVQTPALLPPCGLLRGTKTFPLLVLASWS